MPHALRLPPILKFRPSGLTRCLPTTATLILNPFRSKPTPLLVLINAVTVLAVPGLIPVSPRRTLPSHLLYLFPCFKLPLLSGTFPLSEPTSIYAYNLVPFDEPHSVAGGLRSSNSSTFPRTQPSPPPTGTSPLSYFLNPASSPIKTTPGFTWSPNASITANGVGLSRTFTNEGLPSAVADDYSDSANDTIHSSNALLQQQQQGSPIRGHFRRGSLNAGSSLWNNHPGKERAAGVMRRLSLSGALSGRVRVVHYFYGFHAFCRSD